MKILKDSKYYEILNSIRRDMIKNVGLNFSGPSPPEIFVGDANYPNVNTGILAPAAPGKESHILSSPEEWFKARLNEREILVNRASMIYSKFNSNIKSGNKLSKIMQEVSMAKSPVEVNFELKKKPKLFFMLDEFHKPIFNPAPLKNAVIGENPKVEKRVEYIVGDTDVKAGEGILDLYKHGINVSSINKLLSAGLLGIGVQRKLVPTKWAITCVDDAISKNLITKIRNYDWINEYLVFSDEYLGNHYEILLIPRQFSFEVIEAKYKSDLRMVEFWQDYEGHEKRKGYAANVTGAYYANRLGASEYLEKIKRQASALVLREVKGYEMPCGVGVLREVTRNAMNKGPMRFNDLKSAVENMQTRLKIPISMFLERSILLNEIKTQRKLSSFFEKAI